MSFNRHPGNSSPNARIPSNALDPQELEQAIMHEAEAEAKKILDDAHLQATRIKQHAQTEVKAEREAILQEARQKAAAQHKQSYAKAQQEAQMLKLRRREQLLERVFAEARERLASIPGRPDHVQIGHRLVREAVERLAVDEIIVRTDGGTWENLDEATLKALGEELGVHLIPGERLAQGTGVVLETPEGHRYYDNTLETRLERIQNTLRAPVYRILMDQEENPEDGKSG
jgi:vacuolar-type H+-ATPase subunit E/Vma4